MTQEAEQLITQEEFEYMLANPGVTFLNNKSKVYYHKGDNYFVMQGPNGHHALYAGATDLNRLNAHWKTFSAH